MNRTLLLGTLLVVGAAVGGLLWWKGERRPTTASDQVVTFDLASLPRLGVETAPVSVVVVEDFKCPVCKHFEERIAPELKTRFVDTGQVKVYSLVWPFLGQKFNLNPDDSVLAAQAAQCVFKTNGNEAFQSFKTYLFRAQGDEMAVWATRERLLEVAANVEGLKQPAFRDCLTTDATLPDVQRHTQAALKAGVTGTPSIFVNGKLVQWEKFNEVRGRLFAAVNAELTRQK